MSDDLVTRLKDGFAIRTVIGGYAPDIGGTVEIMAEAADRIEADAATIARLEAERDSASGLALTLQTECERLHGDVAAADAKLAALVEALTLYASESLYDHDGNPDGMKPIERDGGQTARAILWPERFAAKGAK